MKSSPRSLSTTILEERKTYSKMIFISGPRQVGKTTVLNQLRDTYPGPILNWDNLDDRSLIARSPKSLFEENSALYFDEIHKQPRWKNFLKGYFDAYGSTCKIHVTGSARLDVYRRGGDSLLGRYLLFRLHPFSVGEVLYPNSFSKEKPLLEILHADHDRIKESHESWELLKKFGGFPEPFLNQTERFHKQWVSMRHERLVREDIRDMTRIRELALLEQMITLIPDRISQPFSLNSIREDLEVSHDAVKLWIQTLEDFYYLFFIPPFSKKIARTSKKERKGYLWDYSELDDSEQKNVGAKFENMVAAHLLKWSHTYRDLGYKEIDLYFLKNKQKEEVDFLVTQDRKPALLIEAKYAKEEPSKAALKFSSTLSSIPILQLVDRPNVYLSKKYGATSWTLMSASRFFMGLP